VSGSSQKEVISLKKIRDVILVVDDQESLREFLSDLFLANGWDVWSTATAEEALPHLQGKKPTMAIVDLVLPGMSGLDLLAEIKRTLPKTEVILMTSHASLETAIEALDKGAYGYLRKPFEGPEEILRLLERAVEKRRLTEENERLQSDLEKRNAELTAANQRLASLIEAGRAMSAIYEIRELLDFFIEVVASELQVDRASLMLVDTQGEMRIVASRGIRDEVVQSVRVRLGEGISGWVAEKGKPILVKDVRSYPRLQDHDHVGYDSHSFISAPIVLSVPIKIQGKILGVINVTNKRSGQTFTDDDLAFLFSLAGQAAVAIEGAKHFEELKQAYETLRSKEQQIIASERLNALGQMAAGVAHDFNNLLNGILGRTQLLIQQVRAKNPIPPMEEELKWIEQLAVEGGEIIKRIQEFTGLRKDTAFVSTDINQVIRNAVEMTRPKWRDQVEAEGRWVEIRYELGDLPTTSAAPHDLMQVFGNLIFNAVEAMPQGGKLILRTGVEGEQITIQIVDEGIGMTGETQKQIFEPFFTTKPKGKGLGLSIVYGIIGRHGGTIAVESEVGRGTTFTIRLPVVSLKPAVAPPPEPEETPAPAPARILLIEDNDQNRLLFQKILQQERHTVTAASTGQEGMDLFANGEFDLVITDLSMPGLSGLGVAEGVKKKSPKTPVILLSGWGIQQQDEEAKRRGIDLILSKPCTVKELTSAVAMILQKKPIRSHPSS
jgi:signal transduction histidine kinase